MGALQPNTQVTPDLFLLRRLGGGGMSALWVARHRRLDVEVVVKFLSDSLAANPEACARFSREVRSMVQVRSPHVVQVLDHGISESGLPYIVMELLEGGDLAKAMRSRGRFRPDEVQHVIDGCSAALTKVHERGIVHRDIKPANVFLCAGSPRPFIKLVDFGISKRLEDDTMTAQNAVLGTPAYMSPEQMRGEDVDARSDVWALGVLAYHMLAGAPPFRGAHLANIAKSVLYAERPRISAERPELPPALDGFFQRALATDPMQRYQSAQELADALARALGDLAYAGSRGSGPTQVASERTLRVAPATEPLIPVAAPVGASGVPSPSGPQSVRPAYLEPTGRPRTPVDGQIPYGPGPVALPSLQPHAMDGAPPELPSRLKWWVMGTTAASVVLIGIAFRVGYGLRNRTVPPAAAATSQYVAPPPPPAAADASSPAAAPPPPVVSGSNVATSVSVPVKPLPSSRVKPATRK